MRYLFIIILFYNTLPTILLAADKEMDISSLNNYASNSGEKLYQLWEEIMNDSKNRNQSYSAEKWEKLLEIEYLKAKEKKDNKLAFKLSIPLSFTYHAEAKFEKALPLLQNIYKERLTLSPTLYKLVLIKLEEIYRGSNDIENAIIIRKERIEQHLINNFWEIYKECGLYEAAKKDLLQFVPVPPPNSISRLFYYFLLGDLYFQMKEYDSAIIIYKKAQKESISVMQLNNKTHVYNNDDILYWKASFTGFIAKCNIEKGIYENAIPALLYDLKYSRFNTDNLISKMIALSKCYQHYGMYTESRKYIDSAKFYIRGKMVKHIQMELLLTESDFYSLIKQPDSALHYYKLYNQYRDLLNVNLQKNQSILLLAQFEIGKRRSELAESNQSLIDIRKKSSAQNTQIILLIVSLLTSITMVFFIYKNGLQKTKDKRFIEKQNELLQKSNDIINAQFHHNEILLKELHHRVKNNLQVMYSLLNLQKRRNQDKDTIVLLSSVQNRIQTMALLHQNLYTTGDMEMVDISSYVITLTKYLRSIYKFDAQKVHLHYEIDPELKLDIETVVSIGLIINEAVSNAFKYAFSNRLEGNLIIRIHQKENEYTLFIKDDGPGFNEGELKENSLGMKLIKVMCAQLQASYSIEINKGVSHTILFIK